MDFTCCILYGLGLLPWYYYVFLGVSLWITFKFVRAIMDYLDHPLPPLTRPPFSTTMIPDFQT